MALTIAYGFVRRVPPSVSVDDVRQAALIGLWRGLEKLAVGQDGYSPGEQIAFLRRKIRGAILDELRAQDYAPRQRGDRARPVTILGDDFDGWADLPSPSTSAEERAVLTDEAMGYLAARMPPREWKVVRDFFIRGRLEKDTAAELGISPARVCQLRHIALRRMREQMLSCEA